MPSAEIGRYRHPPTFIHHTSACPSSTRSRMPTAWLAGSPSHPRRVCWPRNVSCRLSIADMLLAVVRPASVWHSQSQICDGLATFPIVFSLVSKAKGRWFVKNRGYKRFVATLFWGPFSLLVFCGTTQGTDFLTYSGHLALLLPGSDRQRVVAGERLRSCLNIPSTFIATKST